LIAPRRWFQSGGHFLMKPQGMRPTIACFFEFFDLFLFFMI